MNGLPLTIDLGPLVGRELTQICLGSFQFMLNFDIDVRIAVESSCVYDSASGTTNNITNYSEGASQLCELIGKQVTSAMREAHGGLILRFTNGAGLQILNSNSEYESFQVYIKEQTYVA